MRCVKYTKILIATWLAITSLPAFSIWFEATGQAVVQNGDKMIARQQATQEAIKQALLFAGASVRSVQHMANGLLEDDRFEVRTSGEVDSVELIDEIYQGNIVTVSVRVDIFPQKNECQAADYKKDIVTTWYPISKRQQAAIGNMYDFGKVLADRLQQASHHFAKHSNIIPLEPYYLPPSNENLTNAFTLAQKTNAQYVLFGEITEFGIETLAPAQLEFWKKEKVSRNLSLTFSLFDGISGEMILQDRSGISAPWDFDLHQVVNSNGATLWQSSFGQAAQKLLENVNQKIDEAISCLPAYARVLHVNNEQLTINIGKQHGVKVGDKLTLFQMNQVFDDKSNPFKQFTLHPEKVAVLHVFAQSAVVGAENGMPLANIQPNDLVARR